ncbi:hypothetical protein BD324DRAFT_632928 [Kockovaella imperatae]|uniref:Uncharacterized protein n=1 Tax=Kockovaella imperatae TaxID=4999 RepID=A0A1Y1UBR7_9TREE|nr:hypothetical protein BD324DRAFT_632928 [Kockovaella imperatae]ORX35459.1 hypothetical protein BD324DRAFT_632928 [Kockovaella imperatae]
MGSLLPHNTLFTRSFTRTSSPPQLSTRSSRSSYTSYRRYFIPFICLSVLIFYECWVRHLQSQLHTARSSQQVVFIGNGAPLGEIQHGSASIKRLRNAYAFKRRREDLVKRLPGPLIGQIVPDDVSTGSNEASGTWLNVPHSQVEIIGSWLNGVFQINKNDNRLARTGLNWTMDDEERLNAEVDSHWPAWWANADKVASPWDYKPRDREEQVRMLFLTDYKDYLERMNSHTYEIVDAALRIPYLKVDVWGPGWAGYNRSLSVAANVRRRQCRLQQQALSKAKRMVDQVPLAAGQALSRYAREEERDTDTAIDELMSESEDLDCGCTDKSFDVVWTISDIFSRHDPLLGPLDCGSLLVQQIGDCHNLVCFNEWYPYANNITLSKYAFEIAEIFDHVKVKERYPGYEMGIFGHSPDSGNEWDFYPMPWSEKQANVTVFGYQGSFYPIRFTVSFSLDYDPVPWIRKHPHPGYTIDQQDEAFKYPLETYTREHKYYAAQERIRREFAQSMRESQICLFDASLEKKMIRKFAQALLSGCVIAADLPTEQEQALSRFVIPLSASWDMSRIQQELLWYLERPEKLEQMALDGFVYARQHLTTTRKVDDVVRMSEEHRAGVRGYDFPFGFSSKCRRYWSDDDSYRPPWCT